MDNSPANFSFVEFNDYFGAEEDSKEFTFLYHVYDKKTGEHIEESEVKVTASNEYEARGEALRMLEEGGLDDEEFELVAETFESPYAGAGSLFSIGQNTGLEGFTTSELTTSSAIHGDFDEASLNYWGIKTLKLGLNMQVGSMMMGKITSLPTITLFMDKSILHKLPIMEQENITIRLILTYLLESSSNSTRNTLKLKEMFAGDAEMEMIDDSNARIKNRFGDEIGMVAVDDHDVEDAVVEVSDGSDVIQEVIVSESDTVKKSLLPLALGALAAVVAFPTVTSLLPKARKSGGNSRID